MELKEFISSTLTQIAEGVRDAQKRYSELGGEVNPKGFRQIEGDIKYGKDVPINGDAVLLCDVQFEVALTSENTSTGTGGIGVLFGAFSIGGKTSDTDAKTSLTKISFNVPVKLPSR